jgi:nucleoside-diphosphate-sugar epimerase
MRVVVIDGTGHVGTYLVPRQVAAGHDAAVISRGEREPYRPHGAFDRVDRVELDREAAEAEGTFAERLVEGLDEPRVLLHYGTIWVHGPSRVVPTPEAADRDPLGEYGRNKHEIEQYLLDQAHRGLPATVLHPGHIVGEG